MKILIKKAFLNKSVLFEGNKVVLSKDLNEKDRQNMVNSGMGLYFDNAKKEKVKALKPTNIIKGTNASTKKK